jgi:hypothetical protein
MVKYISNFRLVFSKENLQPRRKVIMRWSSARRKEKIPCKALCLYQGEVCVITMPVCTAFYHFWAIFFKLDPDVSHCNYSIHVVFCVRRYWYEVNKKLN